MKRTAALLMCVIFLLLTFGCSEAEQKERKTSLPQKTELTQNSSEPTEKNETSISAGVTEPTSKTARGETTVYDKLTAPTEAIRAGGRPNSAFSVTTFFSADSCNIVYNDFSAKNPREVKLSDEEKSNVMSVLNREIFSLISYPWDIKLSDRNPSSKLTMTRGNSTITVGLFGTLGEKGYVTVERGAVFNRYTIPAADFNELISILDSVR